MISIVDSFDSYPHAYAVIRESNVTGGPEASIRPPQVGDPLPVLPPTVSSGPETVASAYFLADFDRPHKLSVMFALTRPLKFAAPDTFKTLLEVHARGRFPRDAARIVVFGAREITGPWVIVGSSKTLPLRARSVIHPALPTPPPLIPKPCQRRCDMIPSPGIVTPPFPIIPFE